MAFIFIFFLLFGVGMLVATIMAVIEIASKPFKNEKDKVLWLIIVLLLGGIGPIIYFAMRKQLLATPEDNNREYLPPLEDRQARPQVQTRLDERDDYV